MALRKYQERRHFEKTPEPKGRQSRSTNARVLSFVIHKHAARRLHYDLRLEMGGTLKSWAVPKGPSLDPAEKRLAVNVEDHPLEYATFEGTIPEGQYGAGEVLIWDRGRWIPQGDPEAGYRKGELKFRLAGNKLHGDWALVQMRGKAGGDNGENWLFIKEKDAEAREGSQDAIMREEPQSVASAIAELPGARRAPFPHEAGVALCVPASKAPEGEGWLHEIKFDGYRALCELRNGKARLITRGGNDWTHRFRSVAAAIEDLPANEALLDGEIVMLNADGTSSFQGLQNALDRKTDEGLICYAFDLLHLDGFDLRSVALISRKKTLENLLQSADHRALRYSSHVTGEGPAVHRQACKHGLEGIVSKRADSPYRSVRSKDWLKVKCMLRQEFVIGGFTEPAGSRFGFGALLLGFYESGRLIYAGRVGTGFNDRLLRDLRRRLDAMEQSAPPFANPPTGAGARGAHWVKPELVGEVVFREWTSDGILRQPAFQGLREDKAPSAVAREKEIPVEEVKEAEQMKNDKEKPRAASSKKRDAVVVGGVTLTNPDKMLYPEEGISKADIARYYYDVRDWILPHVADRPLMIRRCPEGHARPCFYQKHANDSTPDAVKSVMIRDEDGELKPYLYINTVEGLVSLPQLGALEIHTWGSRRDEVEKPDQITFDLDPDPSVPWDRVVSAVLDLRTILETIGLTGFLKTSGGKGLHVVVPIERRNTWDEIRDFSRAVAQLLLRTAPTDYLLEASKARRKGRIFVDYHRNGRGATAVAAYSTRARAGAPIATPVGWEELTSGLRPDTYRLDNIMARLSRLKSDPWKDFPTSRARITAKLLKQVEQLAK